LFSNEFRDITVRNKAVPGMYRVTVSFTINKDGIVNDIKADNDPGYGTAEEARRMVLKGPI
jgi:protein TonB